MTLKEISRFHNKLNNATTAVGLYVGMIQDAAPATDFVECARMIIKHDRTLTRLAESINRDKKELAKYAASETDFALWVLQNGIEMNGTSDEAEDEEEQEG